MIRFALIGCGTWGWRYIPSALESLVAKVSHVVRPKSSIDSKWLSEVKIIENWKKLINEPIDAVIIATPPDSHAEIAEYFLSKGIPVIVEKPLTINSKEVINSSNVPFLVNHIHLFSPAYEELQYMYNSILNPGNTYMYGWGGSYGPFRDYSEIWDYAPHDISMCLGLLQSYPKEIIYSKMLERHNITLASGNKTCNIQIWNNSLPKTRRFELFCKDNHFIYDDLSEYKLLLNNSPIIVSDEKPLTNVIIEFVKAIKTGKMDWRFGAKIGQDVVNIIGCLYK